MLKKMTKLVIAMVALVCMGGVYSPRAVTAAMVESQEAVEK